MDILIIEFKTSFCQIDNLLDKLNQNRFKYSF